MRKINTKKIGNKGEKVAVERLEQEGYEILAKNYRNKWGEVDIIAKIKDQRSKKEEVVVFVEVKTKTESDYGEPWEMINRQKLKRVENMGHLWCEEFDYQGLCRIDVVGVWLDYSGEVAKIEHWENVQL